MLRLPISTLAEGLFANLFLPALPERKGSFVQPEEEPKPEEELDKMRIDSEDRAVPGCCMKPSECARLRKWGQRLRNFAGRRRDVFRAWWIGQKMTSEDAKGPEGTRFEDAHLCVSPSFQKTI